MNPLWPDRVGRAPVARRARASRRARRRDRRVYLASHPVIFALLAATRCRAVTRLGRTVLVQRADAYREVLTRLPLDRTAAGTTGGQARALISGGVLFDQEGPAHRDARRSVAADFSAAGVERLRPIWRSALERQLAALGTGDEVDVVGVTAELAGMTVCAMLGLDADPVLVARAAGEVAAAAAAAHAPGMTRPGADGHLAAATQALIRLLDVRPEDAGVAAMLAVAAVNTTVAGIPRAVAWCADGRLWPDAEDARRREVLVSELLRVTAPTGVLPRVAAADGMAGGRGVRAGDRLILVARHAAGGHRTGPECDRPASPQIAQLVFGAGPHACPGAALARAQLADVLKVLAPHRPVVTRARADRRSALPGWRSLMIRASSPAGRKTRPAQGKPGAHNMEERCGSVA